MYIAVCDGVAIFATHIIRMKSIKEPLAEEIICYSKDEFNRAKTTLDKLEIPYTTEPISFHAELKQKTQGVKYLSRSEAIKHIEENIEPESQLIPNLKKRLQEAEAKSALIPDLIARLESAEKELKAVKGIVAIK